MYLFLVTFKTLKLNSTVKTYNSYIMFSSEHVPVDNAMTFVVQFVIYSDFFKG